MDRNYVRFSLLPNRSPSHRASSPSERSTTSVRSGSGSAALPKMSNQYNQRCLQCDQPTLLPFATGSAADRASGSFDGLVRPAEDLNAKMSLQEALSTVPYAKEVQNVRVTFSNQDPGRDYQASFLKRSRIMSSVPNVMKKEFWKQKLPAIPIRPKRPPLEQCPPEQKHFPIPYPINSERRNGFPTQSVGKSVVHEIQTRAPGDIYNKKATELKDELVWKSPHQLVCPRALACSLLSGDQTSLEQPPGTDQSTKQETLSYPVRTDSSEVMPTISELSRWHAEVNESFSTLSTTLSQTDLRPSPLRLCKGHSPREAPPLPVRSPLRDSVCQQDEEGQETLASDLCHRGRLAINGTRSSSYTTVSIYSSEDERSTRHGSITPTSSPPLAPVRSLDHWPTAQQDARSKAEEMREKLGIIDGTYNMYIDSVKKQKHEAVLGDIEDEVAHLSELDRTKSQKMSRTQRRIARVRARREAKRQLVGEKVDIVAQEANFNDWLDTVVRREAREEDPENTSLRSHDQHQNASTRLPALESSSEQDLSETSNEGGQRIVIAFDRGLAAIRHTGEAHTDVRSRQETADEHSIPIMDKLPIHGYKTESMASLNELRGQLVALMNNAQEDMRRTQEHLSETVSRSKKTSETSGSATPSPISTNHPFCCGSTNLQKIEIEWKGKTYPVLIGRRGKLWEAPCTDVHCTEHIGRRTEIPYGMI